MPEASDMSSARIAARDRVVYGSILTVLGVFAIIAPIFAGIGVTIIVGLLLFTAGIIELIMTFKQETFKKGALKIYQERLVQ